MLIKGEAAKQPPGARLKGPEKLIKIRRQPLGFPGGPVVENPRANAGDAGSSPGRGTKIPHAVRQLSPRAATTELRASTREKPAHHDEEPTCRSGGSRMPQLRPDAAKNKIN